MLETIFLKVNKDIDFNLFINIIIFLNCLTKTHFYYIIIIFRDDYYYILTI